MFWKDFFAKESIEIRKLETKEKRIRLVDWSDSLPSLNIKAKQQK